MSENIKKLYNSSGRFDAKQQYKAIIEEAMVSSPEVFTDNSPMLPGPSVPIKNPSALKSLHKFLEALYVRQNISVHRLGSV